MPRWQALGVRTRDGAALPKADITASLLRAGARDFLVYANYEVLLSYNCAHAYAMAVARLSIGDRHGSATCREDSRRRLLMKKTKKIEATTATEAQALSPPYKWQIEAADEASASHGFSSTLISVTTPSSTMAA